jgi:hypothetical protein
MNWPKILFVACAIATLTAWHVAGEPIGLKKHYSLLDLTQQGIEIGYSCQQRHWTVDQCKQDFVTYMRSTFGSEYDR